MKCCLLFPPQWSPLSPHCAPSSLASQLKHFGHDVSVMDLNVEFYCAVLTKEYVNNSIDIALSMEAGLKNEVVAEYAKVTNPNELSQEVKLKAKKYLKIKELSEKIDIIRNTLNYLPAAVETLRHKDNFYSLDLYSKAIYVIDVALSLVSLPYFPAEFSMHDFMIPLLRFDMEEILKYCTDRSLNMYYDYYDSILPSLIKGNFDYTGISIGSYSQVIPGLTLAMLLKSRTKSHINIGGNYFSRVADSIVNCKEFLHNFADSVIVEEGEKPVIELLKYLNNEIRIEDVPNLIYLNNKGLPHINDKTSPLKLNETKTQTLDGFPLNKYFMPEIVVPILASRGCYWKKCTFCDHDFGQTYNVKSIAKTVSEITELNKKYGISYFEFVDEAISSRYLDEFSTEIIKAGLKINWYCNSRLETSLTKEILIKARDAGLRMILWGVESGSERIMELINKGIDLDKRLEILKNTSDADIWNFAYIFFGFPTETLKEAMDTVNMVCENTDIIHAYGRSRFTMGKHALLNQDAEKYGLIRLPEKEEPFSSNSSYIVNDGLKTEELDKIVEYFTAKSIKDYNNPAWMQIRYRETLFLYICKYGKAAVEKMQVL